MIELVSRGLVELWVLCVLFRGLAGEIRAMALRWANTPRALTSSQPRGLEWRAIRPIGNRVLAFRMQVIYA